MISNVQSFVYICINDFSMFNDAPAATRSSWFLSLLGCSDLTNHLLMALSMFTHQVTRGVINPQTITHDGATIAEYSQLREQYFFSNVNAGLLTRCMGVSKMEGGEDLFAAGLPFRSDVHSLDDDMRFDPAVDIYVGNLPAPAPGRVRTAWSNFSRVASHPEVVAMIEMVWCFDTEFHLYNCRYVQWFLLVDIICINSSNHQSNSYSSVVNGGSASELGISVPVSYG